MRFSWSLFWENVTNYREIVEVRFDLYHTLSQMSQATFCWNVWCMLGVVHVWCTGGPLEGVSSLWYHVTSHGYWWLGHGVYLPTIWCKKCLLINVWSEQECGILLSLCKGTREVYFDRLGDVRSTLIVRDHVCVRLLGALQTVSGKYFSSARLLCVY